MKKYTQRLENVRERKAERGRKIEGNSTISTTSSCLLLLSVFMPGHTHQFFEQESWEQVVPSSPHRHSGTKIWNTFYLSRFFIGIACTQCAITVSCPFSHVSSGTKKSPVQFVMLHKSWFSILKSSCKTTDFRNRVVISSQCRDAHYFLGFMGSNNRTGRDIENDNDGWWLQKCIKRKRHLFHE